VYQRNQRRRPRLSQRKGSAQSGPPIFLIHNSNLPVDRWHPTGLFLPTQRTQPQSHTLTTGLFVREYYCIGAGEFTTRQLPTSGELHSQPYFICAVPCPIEWHGGLILVVACPVPRYIMPLPSVGVFGRSIAPVLEIK
jgi:hypothetical protein